MYGIINVCTFGICNVVKMAPDLRHAHSKLCKEIVYYYSKGNNY